VARILSSAYDGTTTATIKENRQMPSTLPKRHTIECPGGCTGRPMAIVGASAVQPEVSGEKLEPGGVAKEPAQPVPVCAIRDISVRPRGPPTLATRSVPGTGRHAQGAWRKGDHGITTRSAL